MSALPSPLSMPRGFLRSLFDRAVAAADPMAVVPPHLPPLPAGRLVVTGAGKASARMAEAVEAALGPCEGLVVTRYGHGRPTRGIEVMKAAHPVPDAAGVAATQRILARMHGLTEDDLVLVLLSGGASALLCAPAPGLTLADKQAVNAALLSSGAPIGEMNLVRKHLSAVKGGRLAAAAWPARVLTLAISDVPGDDPGAIGSGPTVGEARGRDAALQILDRRGIVVPDAVRDALRSGEAPPAPGDPRLARTETRVIAAPSQSLAVAAEAARAAGCEVRMLGHAVEGEAREVAVTQAALARGVQAEGLAHPVLLLSGGEVTVTRRGQGIGGPNAEFCLALALALEGAEGIHALACDTDGIDGAAEVAGAHIAPDTLARGGRDRAGAALAANDAHSFFEAMGDQVVTGPTLTNVNDFRAVLILPSA